MEKPQHQPRITHSPTYILEATTLQMQAVPSGCHLPLHLRGDLLPQRLRRAPPPLYLGGRRGAGAAVPLASNTADGSHVVGGRLQQPQAGRTGPILWRGGWAAAKGLETGQGQECLH